MITNPTTSFEVSSVESGDRYVGSMTANKDKIVTFGTIAVDRMIDKAYIRIAEVSISTIAPNRIGLSMSPHDVPLSDVEQRIITIRPLFANVSAKVETDIISIITKSETELKAL